MSGGFLINSVWLFNDNYNQMQPDAYKEIKISIVAIAAITKTVTGSKWRGFVIGDIGLDT